MSNQTLRGGARGISCATSAQHESPQENMLALTRLSRCACGTAARVWNGGASLGSAALGGGVALGAPVTRWFRTTARLGRGKKQRIQMLRNMVTSLIEHERIKTGQAKAKQVGRLADKLVTAAKRGDMEAHRWASSWVMTKDQMVKLFTVLKGRYENRPGGYHRVLKTYPRMGDAAPMAFVEFVDRPAQQMRMPWPLPEQPTSVMPGRGGRSFRAGKRYLRDEIR